MFFGDDFTCINKESVLIFCNNKNLIYKCKKKCLNFKKIYIVSYDIEIKELIKGIKNFEFILFDSDKEFFSKETWTIIDNLNKIIECQNLKGAKYLYKGSYLIEGGFAQKIEDTLYAIDIFLKIINEKKIDLLYCDRWSEESEIWALQSIAKSKGIKFAFIASDCVSLKYLKQCIKSSNFFIFNFIISFHEKIVGLSNIIKNSKDDNKLNIKEFDIGYILLFDTTKHLNWLLNILNNFDKKLTCCVFCMGADGARKKLQKMDYNAISVEKYFKLRNFFDSVPTYIHDAKMISKSLNRKFKHYFKEVDVTKIIIDLYLNRLRGEKLNFLVYEKIITSFLQENKVYLITGNGDTNYMSCQIFYNVINKIGEKTKFFKDQATPEILNVENMVYEPNADIRDFCFFLKNSTYLKALQKNGWQGTPFYSHDLTYYKFYKKNNEIIPIKNEKKQILWAPSYPTTGQYSIKSFLFDNNIVIEQCKNKDIELYIKYHPAQRDSLTQNIVEKGKQYNNIHFIDKKESIEKYIESADLIITTPSTVILDAALKRKLVICITSMLGYNLVKHLEKGFIIKKSEEFNIDEYINIISKDMKQQNVYENLLRKQDDILRSFYEDVDNPNDILIDIISKMKNVLEVDNLSDYDIMC